MTDALTFTLISERSHVHLFYRCERCPVDVHVAMLTAHARSHGAAVWRIEQR